MAGRGGYGFDRAAGGGGNGGAIYNAGRLGAYRVTFDGNTSGEGGRTS